MKQEIKDELKDIGRSLADMQAAMPHAVPDGYFAGFAAEMNKIVVKSDDELDSLVSKQMPYGMPDGYFDKLPGKIVEKVAYRKPKGIVITYKQLRWAAAAVFFITIGLGAFKMAFRAGEVENGGMLASVADKEIRAYLYSTYQAPMPKPSDNNALDNLDLDPKEIISYLDETGWEINVY